MAYYEFESEWVLTAPIDRVFETLLDYRTFGAWWPSIKRVQLLGEGDADHLGARARYRIKSPLLYSLGFDVTVVALKRPSQIKVTAQGDLAGVGTYLLSHEGRHTKVRYLWNVSTTRAWMNLIAPVARPFFIWAHHSVMREGGAGLARHLGARLVSCQSHVADDRESAQSPAAGVS